LCYCAHRRILDLPIWRWPSNMASMFSVKNPWPWIYLDSTKWKRPSSWQKKRNCVWLVDFAFAIPFQIERLFPVCMMVLSEKSKLFLRFVTVVSEVIKKDNQNGMI